MGPQLAALWVGDAFKQFGAGPYSRSNTADKSERPHIRATYGLGMGVAAQPRHLGRVAFFLSKQ